MFQVRFLEPACEGVKRGTHASADCHIHGCEAGVGEHGRRVGEEEDGGKSPPLPYKPAAPEPHYGAGEQEEWQDAEPGKREGFSGSWGAVEDGVAFLPAVG